MKAGLLVTAMAVVALAACGPANEIAGDVVDAAKGDRTVILTDIEAASIMRQASSDAGLKALLTAGYEPIALITKQGGAVYAALRICDGKTPRECLNATTNLSQPVIHLYMNESVGGFNGEYAVVYPLIGSRHGGVSCVATVPPNTDTGLDGTVAGDLAALGGAVSEQFANALSYAKKAVQIGQAEYNCNTEPV